MKISELSINELKLRFKTDDIKINRYYVIANGNAYPLNMEVSKERPEPKRCNIRSRVTTLIK